MSVPRVTPIKQYSKLVREKAVLKPSAKLFNKSICASYLLKKRDQTGTVKSKLRTKISRDDDAPE